MGKGHLWIWDQFFLKWSCLFRSLSCTCVKQSSPRTELTGIGKRALEITQLFNQLRLQNSNRLFKKKLFKTTPTTCVSLRCNFPCSVPWNHHSFAGEIPLNRLKPNFSMVPSLNIGWWFQSVWKMMEFVSWDDYCVPNWMESHNPFHGSKPPTRRNPSQPASIPASIPPRPAPPLSSHRYWNCSKDMLPSQLYLEGWGKRSLLWYS